MTDLVTATNAMWDTVKDDVRPGAYSWDRSSQIGGIGNWEPAARRHELASRYSWTVTDPVAVWFVAKHAGPAVIDPMAGTGWWAYLLSQAGVDVHASDLHLPGTGGNHWHREPHTWVPVASADGVDAVRKHGAGRTLLLSWPPYDEPAGADILASFPGERVIYIGEGPGGCCGDDRLFELLDQQWTEVAEHRPVQWFGIHDYVTVYNRLATDDGRRRIPDPKD